MLSDHFCSGDVTELAKAMVKVQQALTPACKDAENPFAKSRYATLNSVIDSCRDALVAQGIWVAQYPVPVESGHLGLVTKLVHTGSGQWQGSLMVMPLPKADPQGYGSALTYARRYGLATLVGLVSEADDDAQSAIPGRARPHKGVDRPAASASVPGHADPALAGLPRIDGVTYTPTRAANGMLCVTASGATREKASFLKEAGFRWDGNRKVWWRYVVDQAA